MLITQISTKSLIKLKNSIQQAFIEELVFYKIILITSKY